MQKSNMNYIYLLSFVAIICVLRIESRNAYSKVLEKSIGEPWPMPQVYNKKEDRVLINQDTLTFQIQEYDCDILQSAFKRYYSYIFKFKDNKLRFKSKSLLPNVIDSLKVVLLNPCTDYPNLQSDESYELKIDGDGAELKAKEVWGVLRGLETFSQLVFKDVGGYQCRHTWIKDHPRFPWRGLLIDTSRHFLPTPTILKIIEAMSFNKLNVLHWHIVDDQSFPFQSQTFPELSKKGAYRAYTHEYTPTDVNKVVQYARMRGIRVLPEFDTPGHVESWGKSQGGLLTQCFGKDGKPITGSFGPIDPTNVKNYDFLKALFAEVKRVFPDEYVHLGGDEVPFDCWASNPDIQAFMKNMTYGTDFNKLEGHYITKLLEMVSSLGKRYLVWQEVFDNGVKLKPDTVVHVWMEGWEVEMARVVKGGYRTLLSTPWYLDYVNYGPSWKQYYTAQPANINATSSEKELIMGGEACLWGEWVDATNIHSRLWPSASAMAERLWSGEGVNDVDEAGVRLEEHRCRMLGRGILAAPSSGPGFCEYEIAL